MDGVDNPKILAHHLVDDLILEGQFHEVFVQSLLQAKLLHELILLVDFLQTLLLHGVPQLKEVSSLFLHHILC